MIRWVVVLVALLCAPVSGRAHDFGALATFDVTQSQVVNARRGGVELRLTLSQPVPFRVFTLTEPNRLVLDFREVDWVEARPEDLLQTDRVSDLRFGGFRPGWSRLVATLAAPMLVRNAGLETDPNTGQGTLTVRLEGSDQIDFERAAGAPQDPRWDLPAPAPLKPVERVRDGTLVIVLDPGHGGIDPGAENGQVQEADLMLTMARELRETLRRTGRYHVQMTRDADVFVALETRVAMAQAAGADLFISLHADSLEMGTAEGAVVYTLSDEASDAASAALAERHDREDILSGVDLTQADDRVAGVLMDLARLDNTPRSEALAQHMVDGIRNAVGRVHKRPLRHADFSVLKSADIPSVLVEVGFLSTQDDLRKLQDPVWRASMAAGLRDGIDAWALEDAALQRLRRK